MIRASRTLRALCAIACCFLLGCAARRAGGQRTDASPPPLDATAAAAVVPAFGYRTHFVGAYPEGSVAFVEHVGAMLARHPALRDARWGDTELPLQLELTLTNRRNGFVAALSGIACGLSFTLLPAYARDDFDLDVEVREGSRALWRRQYHDAVTTFVHFTLVFAPRAEQPRIVVEDVVDDLLARAFADLAVANVLQTAAAAHGAEKGNP